MDTQKTNFTIITLIASLGGVLFGFDMAVISGILPLLHKQYSFTPAMEGWLVSSALVGCILGVMASGVLSDRFGRKKMLGLSAAIFLVSAAGSALSADLDMLIAFRIVGGLGVGIASNVVPLYISEIAPVDKRGRLVSLYQLAITLGILMAYLFNSLLLNYGMNQVATAESGWLDLLFVKEMWRGMFLVGIIPSTLYLLGSIIVPESPRWLLRNDAALTNQGDEKLKGEGRLYQVMLSKEMRKPLLLGILLPLFSQLSGINAIIYYGPRILGGAGLDLSNALHAQIFFGLANVLFTMIAIWKVDSLGRRPLYLIGSLGAALSLTLVSIHFFVGFETGLFLGILVILFLMCFACSIGPLKFVIVSEIFPDHIRGRAMAMSIMVMWLSDTIIGQITPMLLSLSTGLTFGIFATCCFAAFLTVFKIYPETKGKTFEQIQSIWNKS